jgi:putative transposase
MEQPTSAGLPEQWTVRELRVRVGRRGLRTQGCVVVTTLLDARLSSAHDVAALSGQRWHGALALRSLKVALGMDVLRCRTPAMVRKELWMEVLASPLIRAVMVRAALSQGRCPRQRSFTGVLQAVNGFPPALV